MTSAVFYQLIELSSQLGAGHQGEVMDVENLCNVL